MVVDKKKSIINKWDMLVFVIFLLIGTVSIFFIRHFFESGNMVYIYEDGKVLDIKEMSEEGTYEYKTEYGENIVVIKDGEVFVKDADCPDKLCVKQGKINSDKETIICLPHKFVVEVRKK